MCVYSYITLIKVNGWGLRGHTKWLFWEATCDTQKFASEGSKEFSQIQYDTLRHQCMLQCVLLFVLHCEQLCVLQSVFLGAFTLTV